jgi:hypothetical protein
MTTKMNKIFKIIALLLFVLNLSAQEKLVPLTGNLHLINSDYTNYNLLSQKTTTVSSVSIPFFDDFYYAATSPYPSSGLWADSSVYVNTGFAIAPPTIGVATFDGLNKKGSPYNIYATAVVSGGADTLTSKPINLFTSGSQTLTPADSLGFSFLYQAAGFGDNPEIDDSLIVDFYKPLYTSGTSTVVGRWVKAWGTRGLSFPNPGDSTFKRAFVRIEDTAYFHDGFKLRFRNKATTSGSLDLWHVDYVNLKKNYSIFDTTYRDIAFGYMPRPFLKSYSAMPWEQYYNGEMGTSFSNFIRNNDTIAHNGVYQFTVCTSALTQLNTYNGGSQKIVKFNNRGWDSIPQHANPVIGYTFPTPSGPTSFVIKHAVNTSPDDWRYNDSCIQTLTLDNYYAYDDGSAEAGYYLNTYGAMSALRYTVNNADTLQALDIFFDPIKELNILVNPSFSNFRICVWSASGTQPGTLLLKDSTMFPTYFQFGYNKIPRYKLSAPMLLSPGTYFFGIQQKTAQGLNIGFDKNLDHSNALYYDIGSGWTQSGIPGSLMIHAVFGSAAAAVGIKENDHSVSNNYLTLYPNPASNLLYVQNQSKELNSVLEIYSSVGQKVLESNLTQSLSQINTGELNAGLYFVVLKNSDGVVSQQKLIITK